MKYIFFVLLLSFSNCSSPKEKTSAYFIPIFFTKFSSINAPCLEVQIENQTFSLELDLGFQGDLTIDAQLLGLIARKTFLQSATLHDIQGNRYKTHLFRIPEASIGTTTFTELTIQSNSQTFTKNSAFTKNSSVSLQEKGRIGWQFFKNTCLLIDVAEEKIALCDCLDTLRIKGYPIENLAKTKLFTNRGLLEFDAVTDAGNLRCTLDTGASCNVMHAESDRSMREMLLDPENTLQMPQFIIGEQEFGPLSFRQIPIKIPIPIQAILGMQFFQEHLVFIDFAQSLIYFAPHSGSKYYQ